MTEVPELEVARKAITFTHLAIYVLSVLTIVVLYLLVYKTVRQKERKRIIMKAGIAHHVGGGGGGGGIGGTGGRPNAAALQTAAEKTTTVAFEMETLNTVTAAPTTSSTNHSSSTGVTSHPDCSKTRLLKGSVGNKSGTAQVGALSNFFPIFFRNFFEVSGKSHSAKKCKRGDPSGFFGHPLCCKISKN